MEEWPPISVEPVHAEAQATREEEMLEEPPLCVVRRTVAMGDLEQRLQFAMVASVGGRRPVVTCEQVFAALKWRGVSESAMSVHVFSPEDFLVVFASEELRNHVASRPPVLVAGAPLSCRPWNRQAQAVLVPMKQRVSLVLEGIPPHAWDLATVEDLLGRSCAVEEVAPETKAWTDLALFKLTAWTSQIEAIPVARTLAVPEPVSGGGGALRSAADAVRDGARSASQRLKTLQYKVLVHIMRIEEEASPDVDAETGAGADGPGGAQGRGPRGGPGGGGDGDRRRSRDLAWRRGVPDRRRGPGGVTARVHGGVGIRREVGDDDMASPAPHAWGLPCMESPVPRVAVAALDSQKATAVAAKAGVVQGVREEGAARIRPLASDGDGERCAGLAQPLTTAMQPLDGELLELEEDKGLQESAAGVGPKADKVERVVWQDAEDSLPFAEADPEDRGRTEEVGSKGVCDSPMSAVSPTPSCVGSSVGGQEVQSVEEHQQGLGQSVLGKENKEEEFFAVSVSISDRPHTQAQLGSIGKELCLSEEELGSEGSPCQSYTGPNSAMQMVPREEAPRSVREVEPVQELPDSERLQQERLEMARVKSFCASILKTLAPPLLHEVERATKLRAEAEPFTPKRVTRRTIAAGATTQGKKASAAESALLKVLGICPENLSVCEEDLVRFRGIFDSPIGDPHLRVLASIFGKELPSSFATQEYCRVAVAGH
jgi:hypothetical protein